MQASMIRNKPLIATAALFALALVDAMTAWLLGSDPLLPGLASGAGAGATLLFWGLGHCDGMDGPVITAAKQALESRNVNGVLAWVRKDDEEAIRLAFGHALAVRELGAEAKALADEHFFETLVRIHRAGEGAPFTGLKPAGRDLGPAVPAADAALESGSDEALAKLLTDAVREGLHERFHAAASRKRFAIDEVAHGREFVERYVPYVHYVEQLWKLATGHAGHSHAEHAH
jgi:hypothetical protein